MPRKTRFIIEVKSFSSSTVHSKYSSVRYNRIICLFPALDLAKMKLYIAVGQNKGLLQYKTFLTRACFKKQNTVYDT